MQNNSTSKVRRTKSTLQFLSAMAFAGLASGAAAAPFLQYDYTATVQSDTTIDGTFFSAGQMLAGEFRVEKNTPYASTWFGDIHRYDGALTGLSAHANGMSFVGNGAADVEVRDNRRLFRTGGQWEDAFLGTMTTANGVFDPIDLGGGVSYMQFYFGTPLVSPAPTVLTNKSLIETSTVLASFPNQFLTIGFIDGSFLRANLGPVAISQVDSGVVVGARVAPVPEPASLALVGLGLAGVLALRGRRKARV